MEVTEKLSDRSKILHVLGTNSTPEFLAGASHSFLTPTNASVLKA